MDHARDQISEYVCEGLWRHHSGGGGFAHSCDRCYSMLMLTVTLRRYTEGKSTDRAYWSFLKSTLGRDALE
jgi:hypothetical protein